MKKEKVIIFEGEQNFVIPKNRVRDKKTGISYYVPDEMNVTAPVGTPMEAPIEPPRQPDDPIGSPKTTTTQEEDASKPTTVPQGVTLVNKAVLPSNIDDPNIQLGNPTKQNVSETTNDVCLQYTVFDVSDSSTSSFSYIPCGSSTRSTVSISDGGDEVTICAKMNSIETITGRIEIQGGVACGGSNPPPPPPPPPAPAPSPYTIPLLPIDTIVSTSKTGGGFGGGGGGSKEGASAPKKTFLQKYWWLLLLIAGGGYYYYKKKNK